MIKSSIHIYIHIYTHVYINGGFSLPCLITQGYLADFQYVFKLWLYYCPATVVWKTAMRISRLGSHLVSDFTPQENPN